MGAEVDVRRLHLMGLPGAPTVEVFMLHGSSRLVRGVKLPPGILVHRSSVTVVSSSQYGMGTVWKEVVMACLCPLTSWRGRWTRRIVREIVRIVAWRRCGL